MGVSLSKRGNVSLTKEAPGLTAVSIGLGVYVAAAAAAYLAYVGIRRFRESAATARALVQPGA